MRNIIFLNGFMVPTFVAKSQFVWNDLFWKNYNTIFYNSKSPISDDFVEAELFNLTKLIKRYENPIIAGHSLGSWWLANLLHSNQFITNKAVLLTPLSDPRPFPIFNVSKRFALKPNNTNYGKQKVLLCYGTQDLIVPYQYHIPKLIKLFDPTIYPLLGGHFYQSNHQDGLSFMKEWIEKDI